MPQVEPMANLRAAGPQGWVQKTPAGCMLDPTREPVMETPDEASNANPSSLLLVASLIAFAAVVSAALILFHSEKSLLAGLAAPFYYVILVGLGCFAALALLGAMRGYAHWSGHAVGGALQIGGSVAVAAMTVIGGSYFRPEASTNLVVRIVDENMRTELLCPTVVKLLLGQDVRTGEIGQNCQAQFNEVPERFLRSSGLDVQVSVRGYVRAGSGPVPISPDHVLLVPMRKVAEKSMAWGRLIYPGTKGPVVNAVMSIDGGLASGKTDSAGQFRFEVPLPEGRSVQLTAEASNRVVFDERVTLPIASTLTAHLAQ